MATFDETYEIRLIFNLESEDEVTSTSRTIAIPGWQSEDLLPQINNFKKIAAYYTSPEHNTFIQRSTWLDTTGSSISEDTDPLITKSVELEFYHVEKSRYTADED